MDPYLGEIRMFAGMFPPVGWAFCEGQALQIAQYDALYTLIGTTYGGDGQTTFCLPNLASRIPFGSANDLPVGQSGGEESVTLTTQQLPQHRHGVQATGQQATSTTAAGNVWAAWGDGQYATGTPTTSMAAAALSVAGGSQPHENRPPILALSFIIAVDSGIYPSP